MSRIFFLHGLLWLIACGCAAWAASAQTVDHAKAREPWFAQVTHVVDGDSVWVRAEEGKQRRKLRLRGIDAPEICQLNGVQSRAALQDLVEGQRILVTVRAYDRYARGIATIERVADKLDVASHMVSQGWAWSEDYRGRKGLYWREQAQASGNRKGVFAKSKAESPTAFRKRHGPCNARKK